MSKPLSYTFKDIDIQNNETFAGIFASLRGNDEYDDYIDYRGLKVHPLFRMYLIGECKIQINWIKTRQDFPQGIDASIHNARLNILDGSKNKTKKGFVFMYDRWFPKPVPLLCTPIKFHNKEKQHQGKWVSLYNVWEREVTSGHPVHTYMHRESWWNNYGVVIEKKRENNYRLYFSCGVDKHLNITFEDLIVDVSIEGEYTTRFQCSGDPRDILKPNKF